MIRSYLQQSTEISQSLTRPKIDGMLSCSFLSLSVATLKNLGSRTFVHKIPLKIHKSIPRGLVGSIHPTEGVCFLTFGCSAAHG